MRVLQQSINVTQLLFNHICILENSFWSLLSALSSSLVTLCPSLPLYDAICGWRIHLCSYRIREKLYPWHASIHAPYGDPWLVVSTGA